ncbi:putative MSP domain-containing protein [Vibrio chagasii]|nr:putative MSP domain-containing protein [Vibrio chagasii]CAH7053756.1 putative MSP domain-containing protein [Vibrio chagasii]CAH7064875.1 putative MSP domain-containing protein [Vibrio chagasii]CAH7362457.1 putative MSP domain-containing protein [Vibrio chagasii]CAH7377686.1 putative MSP domain-containing protein [Vibrio chagasii]
MKKNIKWYATRLTKMKPKELYFRFYELFLLIVVRFLFKYRKTKDKSSLVHFKETTVLEELYKDKDKDKENKIEVLLESCKSKTNSYDNDFFKSLKFNGDDYRLLWNDYRFNDILILSMREQCFFNSFLHFKENNPYLHGINYISTMECAIRCINLYSALTIQKEKGRYLSCEENIEYFGFFEDNLLIISTRISRFSSRGNHTLFEYAGCYICSLAINNQRLVDKYYKLLIEEIDFQINSDGSGIEQSIDYHMFNLDVIILLEYITNIKFISDSKRESSLNFLSCFLNDKKIIRFGDSDSSFLFSRIKLLDLLNNNSNFRNKMDFEDGGYLVVVNDSFKVIIKYGGLGMYPLFGHGHYDFLSLSLSHKGKEITKDSMTYLYSSKLRKKIRSIEYHSMPFIDEDIKQLSNFSWEKDKKGEVLSTESNTIYSHLSFAYPHQTGQITRDVYIFNDFIIVVDSTECENVGLNVSWLLDFDNLEFLSIYNSKFISLNPKIEKINFSTNYGCLNDVAHRVTVSSSKRIISVWNYSKMSNPDLIVFFKEIMK